METWTSPYKEFQWWAKRKVLSIQEKLKIMKSFKRYKNERLGGRSEGVIIRENANKREIHTYTHTHKHTHTQRVTERDREREVRSETWAMNAVDIVVAVLLVKLLLSFQTCCLCSALWSKPYFCFALWQLLLVGICPWRWRLEPGAAVGSSLFLHSWTLICLPAQR